MKDTLEYLFFLGGSILVFGKLGSIALGLILLLYGCFKFHKFITNINLLKEYCKCQ